MATDKSLIEVYALEITIQLREWGFMG